MVVKKKPEETVEIVEEVTEEVEVEEVQSHLPFNVRLRQLGTLIRSTASDVLQFDSNVSNIDYDYVDTQQYKKFLGACCDQVDGIMFSCDTEHPHVEVQFDNKGIMIFVVDLTMRFTFYDVYTDDYIENTGCGLGVSRGSNYALTIAQTNAIRNYITNNFLLPTSDREMDMQAVETLS